MLVTRAQAQNRQDVMNEVLNEVANSPKTRQLQQNDFDQPEGFKPPTDDWLDTLRSLSARGGGEQLQIRVKLVIEDDWVSDVYDRFKVLLESQDVSGQEVTWRCGTVTEAP
jgi:hypothetical protein